MSTVRSLLHVATWLLIGMLFGMLLILGGCSGYGVFQHAPLPHRPDTMNHGQGHNPGPGCIGQYHEYVETPDGSRFFLECWGLDSQR